MCDFSSRVFEEACLCQQIPYIGDLNKVIHMEEQSIDEEMLGYCDKHGSASTLHYKTPSGKIEITLKT